MASFVLLPEQKVLDLAIRRRRNPTWQTSASSPTFQLSNAPARAAARKHRSSATGTSRAFGHRTLWGWVTFSRFGRCRAILLVDYGPSFQSFWNHFPWFQVHIGQLKWSSTDLRAGLAIKHHFAKSHNYPYRTIHRVDPILPICRGPISCPHVGASSAPGSRARWICSEWRVFLTRTWPFNQRSGHQRSSWELLQAGNGVVC